MAGSPRTAFNPTVYIIFGYLRRLCSPVLMAAAFASGMLFVASLSSSSIAHADHFMCGKKVERRIQTVWVDPNLTGTGVTHADVLKAFEDWNRLFLQYHGLPVFVVHAGPAIEADIVISSRGSPQTWVQTSCAPGYVPNGSTHSIVLLGRLDAWRNRQMLAHELGHALGFADHGSGAQHVDGHIGFKPCDNTYFGVMSYCTGVQSWFLDYILPGITLDGGMVQRYW